MQKEKDILWVQHIPCHTSDPKSHVYKLTLRRTEERVSGHVRHVSISLPHVDLCCGSLISGLVGKPTSTRAEGLFICVQCDTFIRLLLSLLPVLLALWVHSCTQPCCFYCRPVVFILWS